MGRDRVWYHIPIKFWVYRSSAGTGGPTLEQLQVYIDNLNSFFNAANDTKIGFYLKCDISYIDDDDHLVINNDLEAWSLIQNHKEMGCINIHITNVLNDATGVHYRARFFGVDGIFLNEQTYTRPALIGTIAHEVGHYLELDHTHQYSNRGKCRKEPVSRTRTWPFITFCPFGGGGPTSQNICEATGDFLRDTPADHDLSSNNSCAYVITGQTDPWGDHYETPPTGSLPPDPANLMNYNGNRSCRTGFSRLQIAVMLHSIVRGKSKNNRAAWDSQRAEYDEYEPDNHFTTARTIEFGEIQERNFHQQILTEVSGNPVWSQCDVDWVRFVAPCTGDFEILTSIMPGKTAADTRLTLFNNTMTQLAQHDNISGSNLFSSITWSFVNGQEYFIRVENMSSSLVTSYYRLSVGALSSISGDNSFCATSTAYSIPNLPAGSTVTWSATPSGAVGFSCNPCNSIALTRNYDATVSLTATITNTCGGGPFVVTRNNIVVGNPPVLGPSGADTAWPNGHYTYTMFLPLGFSPATYTWSVPTGWTIVSGQSTNSIYVYTGTVSGPVEVEVTICGTARPVYKYVVIGSGSWWPDGGGGDVYMRQSTMLSPNPADNFVTISMGNNNSIKTGKEANTFFNAVTIYDITGAVKKRLRYTTGTRQARVNTSDLRPGAYIVEITDGRQVERQQLIIQK